MEKNVVGAHALGFNTGSVGVAVIGLVQLGSGARQRRWPRWRSSWPGGSTSRMSIRSGRSTVVSGGSEKLQRRGGGRRSGRSPAHRDTGLTACPGDSCTGRIAAIAAKAHEIGQPKLYDPGWTGELGGPVRFRARVSRALPWTVTVIDALGQNSASGAARGRRSTGRWDSARGGRARVSRWTDRRRRRNPRQRDAREDGRRHAARRSRSRTLPRTRRRSARTGRRPPTAPRSRTRRTRRRPSRRRCSTRPGRSWPRLAPPARLRRGLAQASPSTGSANPTATTRSWIMRCRRRRGIGDAAAPRWGSGRALGPAAVAPSVFTPNGDGSHDELTVSFQLGAAASVRLRVLREGELWVATPFTGPARGRSPERELGRQQAHRDGTGRRLHGGARGDRCRRHLPGGAALHARPRMRRRSSWLARPLRVWVSEASAVTVRVNGALLRARPFRRPGPCH